MKRLLSRFVDIWKLDFLAKFFAGEKDDKKTTILFWISSNLLITIILMVPFYLFLHNASNELMGYVNDNIANGAQIIIADGQLTTQNIEEPFFREISAQNGVSGYNESYAIIIDTQSDTYDITSLDEYRGGVVVKGDRLYFKDENKIRDIIFSNVNNLSISKEQIIEFINEYSSFLNLILFTIFVGIFVFVWFVGFRLAIAFWWALLLFMLIKIFDINEEYMTAYKAVLNLYFIPTIAVFGVSVAGFSVPMLTTLIFLAVFIANLIWIKKHPQIEEVDNLLDEIPEVEVGVVKQTEKE